MKINKESGLPLQIYISNFRPMQSFEMEFYTNPTAPKAMNIGISYDGMTYASSTPWEKGVYLYAERKFSSAGDILCRATHYVPTPNVAGGVQKIVMAGVAGKDAGMDYLKLAEQIVPGEFTLNGNQVRSQLPYPETPIAV